jgi:hypothetical protein
MFAYSTFNTDNCEKRHFVHTNAFSFWNVLLIRWMYDSRGKKKVVMFWIR